MCSNFQMYLKSQKSSPQESNHKKALSILDGISYAAPFQVGTGGKGNTACTQACQGIPSLAHVMYANMSLLKVNVSLFKITLFLSLFISPLNSYKDKALSNMLMLMFILVLLLNSSLSCFNCMTYFDGTFHYCCPDYPSCPAYLKGIGWSIWAIWAAVKVYNLIELCNSGGSGGQ